MHDEADTCIQKMYEYVHHELRAKASWPTVRFVQNVLRGSAGVNLAGETNSRHTQYTQYAQCIELEGVRMRTVELFSNMNIHESSAARASRR